MKNRKYIETEILKKKSRKCFENSDLASEEDS